eukprot:COSAG05_NODE_3257_length_2199_cov_26.501741_1_plen_267_part_10
MPFYKKEKSAKKEKGKKKSKKGSAPAPAPAPVPAAEKGSGEEEEEEDLLGDQSWAKTEADDFSSEVDALFAAMKATMGAADSMPDVKFGKMGDEMATDKDFENEEEAEPEPEPEPAPRPVRVKLSKEEKMAKMKEMAKAREAAGGGAGDENVDDADAAALRHCEEVFNKYDADGGGSIDADELAALCYDMGMVFEDEADKDLVLTMLDTDGDGTVDMDEFKVWWMANKDSFFVQDYSENVKAAIYYFKKFDEDLSGELDQTEFVAMC